MKIVAHNGSPFFGGGEIWLSLLLAELQKRGHDVLLLCKNDEIKARAGAYGIATEVFAIGGDAVLTDALRFAFRLRRIQPDVLLLTTFRKAWLGGMGARMAGVPRVLARVAISTIAPRNWKYRVAMRHWLDAVIVNAEEIREGFMRALPELEAHQVLTIYDGIVEPVSASPHGALRRELGLCPESRVIGSVARLDRQKRIDRLLHAFAELPDDVHCILAGEGPDHGKLQALARELGVADRVHFIGFRADVRSVLDALDVFVLASDWEGLANAMLEAMLVGVPVVSTRVSGTSVALAPNGDGIAPGIVTDFDERELATAMHTLLDDQMLRARMGAAGQQRVRERFGFVRMVDEWEEVLQLK